MSASLNRKCDDFIVRPRSGKLDLNSYSHLDPYLTIQYGGQWIITKVCKKTEKYPLWTEEFPFKYNEYLQDLFVECWDYNLTNSPSDSFIGKGILKIKADENANSIMQWLTLEKGGQAVGEVFFEIDFVNEKFVPHLPKTIENAFQKTIPKGYEPTRVNHEQNGYSSKPLITKQQLDDLMYRPQSLEEIKIPATIAYGAYGNERGSPRTHYKMAGEEGGHNFRVGTGAYK